MEKAICANPELANLDREINAVNARVVREATSDDPRAGRALQREQDDFIARRNAEFGRPGYDLQKAMKERLEHLLASSGTSGVSSEVDAGSRDENASKQRTRAGILSEPGSGRL